MDVEEYQPYARASIPEVWIMNIPEEAVEIHSRPEADEYRETMRTKALRREV